jgi:hypothetical protein
MPTFISNRKLTTGVHTWTVKCEFAQGRFASIGVAVCEPIGSGVSQRTNVGLGWRGRSATLAAGLGWALDVGDGQKVSLLSLSLSALGTSLIWMTHRC